MATLLKFVVTQANILRTTLLGQPRLFTTLPRVHQPINMAKLLKLHHCSISSHSGCVIL
ncbi:Uncharacterised protein [Vibrio cholerae]|nr:Uncharacterised protein [Vibrio cholerae]CSD40603.1 Uncharacterised protein [Vibrio cholerae]CSI23396.1 Uncharacterised protein [Vibrio cholerae]CSI79560.1 Uncharacterised protein [Vibrio cholerae]